MKLYKSNCKIYTHDLLNSNDESERKSAKIISHFFPKTELLRYQKLNSFESHHYLRSMIKDTDTKEVLFFSTFSLLLNAEISQNEKDYAPWLSALIITSKRVILCDGDFLTTATPSHEKEIFNILEEAQKSSKVSYCSVPVDFTSTMKVNQAISHLLETISMHKVHLTSLTCDSFLLQLNERSKKAII